jgi:hypothetical protein
MLNNAIIIVEEAQTQQMQVWLTFKIWFLFISAGPSIKTDRSLKVCHVIRINLFIVSSHEHTRATK